MYKEYFKKYLKLHCDSSDSTVEHYVTAVNTISKLLSGIMNQSINLFEIDSITELNNFREILNNNNAFLKKNLKGNRMYSSGFNNYNNFMCQTNIIHKNSLSLIDIPIIIKEKRTIAIKADNRDRAIISHSLQNAGYLCEIDNSHCTFTNRTNNMQYVEGHHIIPLRQQSKFKNSLDCYANIISLCPNCHRMLHYGCVSDIRIPIKEIFNCRAKRFENSGVLLSENDFLTLIGV